TGNLTVNGAGILVLSGVNTYTGTSNFNAGTTQINAANKLGASSALTFNGGTLQTTATPITLTQGITLNASGGTISPDAATVLTLSGIISGAGNFTMSGAGTLVLSGVNTYTGATSLTAGITQISNGN